jgi:8-oxo-dGTP pyrophosphatase MutT (NUDIX family)
LTPIPAATVVLLRPGAAGLEVFLVRRHRRSSFMSNAFVFPGGKLDPGETAPMAAARELFEEAGVLLADRPLDPGAQTAWRKRLNAGEVDFPKILEEEKLGLDVQRLHAWSRWVTPSFEPKRFDAEFYLAELPPEQVPSFDAKETIEELWVTPADALARHAAGALPLPPPQVRTFLELRSVETMAAAVAAAAERQRHPAALCPRLLPGAAGITLLFPWDPDYASAEGEGTVLPPDHPWATPPSRLSWDGGSWR